MYLHQVKIGLFGYAHYTVWIWKVMSVLTILFSPLESGNVPISSKGMLVWTAIDNKIYRIAFNVEKSKFDSYLALVQQMTAS
jgi:hypothetical protein